MGWLSREELKRLGFRSLGEDVLISDRATLHGAEHMRIGSHVRIDDFAVITAREPVAIGSYVHISAHVFVGGTAGVELADFVNLSVGAAVFSASDDFSGRHLLGPTVPDHLREVTAGRVTFDRYTGVGANSVVLPGVHFPEGSGVTPLTLVSRSLPEPWTLYGGVPMRRIRTTFRDRARLGAELLPLAEAGTDPANRAVALAAALASRPREG